MNARLLVALLLVQAGWAQTVDDALQAKLNTVSSSYSLHTQDSLHALLKMAGDFQLPIGIEWVRSIGPTEHFDKSWQDAAPATILQDILARYPGYEMEVSNSVVHVFPAAIHNDAANILNTRIGEFQANREYVRFAASRLGRQLLPIMVPPDPTRAPEGWGSSIATGKGDRPVTFIIENATVRDVLDKLCLAADLNMWVVAYPSEPAKSRGGFLKTIRLDEAVPPEDDHFYLVFHFLFWGNPIAEIR
jgi:hypothetical protein